MAGQGQISENSKRIAKNTVFLYFRMLLLLFVGLFTSRVVLKTLGAEDFGTYNVVGGVVTMFTVLTNAIATAISRFLNREIGKNDQKRLKRVFSTSVYIQIIFCIAIAFLVETAGLWFLNHRMDIPDGRLGAANWVLHCSLVMLMLQLLSVPFNAAIMAHEHMQAYAYISILEGLLKLSVATLLFISGFDKLKTYAVLMAVVAVIVRISYSAYCRRHFEESRSRPSYDKELTREMLGFASWNALSSATLILNTQGINILTNLFFGVIANAARGVASQVENITKQFVFNVMNAFNPQIMQSYNADNKEYSYSLVSKAMKYAFFIMLFFTVPTVFEAETILQLWLGDIPEQSALFTKLIMVCTTLDVMFSPASTLVLADGRIKGFYMTICSISVLAFPIAWLTFRSGAPAYAGYIVFAAIYFIFDIVKMVMTHRITGYPYSLFFHDVLLKVLAPTALAFAATALTVKVFPDPTWQRAILSTGISTLTMLISAYFFSLSEAEKGFVKSIIHRIFK